MHLRYPIGAPKRCLGVPALLIRPRLRWKDRLNINSLSPVNVSCGDDRAFAAVSTPRESAKETRAVPYGCPTDIPRVPNGPLRYLLACLSPPLRCARILIGQTPRPPDDRRPHFPVDCDQKIASAYDQAAAQLHELRDAYAQADDSGGVQQKLRGFRLGCSNRPAIIQDAMCFA